MHLNDPGPTGHQGHLHHVVVPDVAVVGHHLGPLVHAKPRDREARVREIHPDDGVIPVH